MPDVLSEARRRIVGGKGLRAVHRRVLPFRKRKSTSEPDLEENHPAVSSVILVIGLIGLLTERNYGP